MESLTSFLRRVCPSRRPGSHTQGVCDEADGPVSEARRDVSRQAPFTHIHACQHTHAGPIGSAGMVCVHLDSTRAEMKAESSGFTKSTHTKMQQIFVVQWFLLVTEVICTLHKIVILLIKPFKSWCPVPASVGNNDISVFPRTLSAPTCSNTEAPLGGAVGP